MTTAERSMTERGRVLRVLLICWALSIAHWALPRAAAAQTPPPQLTEPVNDFAHVLDSGSKAELDRRIRALQQTTGDVAVVATVPTYQPYADINEFAVKMFENGGRGIGQKGKDNGVLIVLAVNDRKVRIEVGYDLEAFITDGFAGELIRNVMAPEFRQGRYGTGLLAATTRIINRVAQGRGVTVPNVPATPARGGPRRAPRIPFSVIIFIIFIILALSRGNRPRRRRTYWGGGPWSGWSSGVGPFGGGGFGGGFGGFGGGGGGGGGGFGGFGGGRSGGGGASGGW